MKEIRLNKGFVTLVDDEDFDYFNRKQIHLGYFNDPDQAAKVRDEASLKYFGEFAYLNFKL